MPYLLLEDRKAPQEWLTQVFNAISAHGRREEFTGVLAAIGAARYGDKQHTSFLRLAELTGSFVLSRHEWEYQASITGPQFIGAVSCPYSYAMSAMRLREHCSRALAFLSAEDANKRSLMLMFLITAGALKLRRYAGETPVHTLEFLAAQETAVLTELGPAKDSPADIPLGHGFSESLGEVRWEANLATYFGLMAEEKFGSGKVLSLSAQCRLHGMLAYARTQYIRRAGPAFVIPTVAKPYFQSFGSAANSVQQLFEAEKVRLKRMSSEMAEMHFFASLIQTADEVIARGWATPVYLASLFEALSSEHFSSTLWEFFADLRNRREKIYPNHFERL